VYFMWDTLSTSYLGCNDLATFRKEELEVLTEVPSEGKTSKKAGSGQHINVAKEINAEKFYDFFLA